MAKMNLTPDRRSDMECLKQLFPAHEERISQIAGYQAIVITADEDDGAKMYHKWIVNKTKAGGVKVAVSPKKLLLSVHLPAPTTEPLKIAAKNALDEFPPFTIDGFDAAVWPGLEGWVLMFKMPVGFLSVFYQALVGTSMFRLIKILYLRMLEAENSQF
jgi:hypothetical protein